MPRRRLSLPPPETYTLTSAVQYHSDKRPSPFAPHPEVHTGEDAYCVVDCATHHVLGVADGVGGWSTKGVDPSEFSWTLMNSAAETAATTPVVQHFAQAILGAGYAKLNTEQKVTAGSSTAALVTLNKHTGLLEVANLGDSGVAVIRGGEFALITRDQQHYFNCPYQLAVVPPGMKSSMYSDHPDMADVHSLEAQDGDVIVLVTDGYSDNVFPSTTLELAKRVAATAESPTALVDGLATEMLRAARERAASSTAVTPFSVHAAAEGYDFKGGKRDDITLIVAQVAAGGSHDSSVAASKL